ncbi:MAG: SPOR domain-containing protein [Muribaculaceae bacterium]|nr:SPOR domain-containing protein [Muribaculaceae bacterium]
MMVKARLALTILIIMSPLLGIFAQEPDSINSIVDQINASGVIRVNQPEKLNAEMRRLPGASFAKVDSENDDAPAVRTGYRVQVYDDNNPRSARSQAEHVRSEVTAHFPQYNAYVTFNSPYWRVKVGDFKNRAEAEQALAEIRAAIPRLNAYLRIVRDKINN